MQDNVRKITFGAAMIALFVMILAVSLYVPILWIITLFVIPLPIVLYRLRYDRASSLLMTATGIILSLLVGGIALTPFAFGFGLLGIVMGETVSLGKTKLYTLMATGLTLLMTSTIMYVVAVFAFNFNVIEEFFLAIEEARKQMATVMEPIGGLPDNYNEMVNSQIAFYETAIPSLYIIGVYVLAFIYTTLNLGIASRLGNKVQKFPPFHDMKLPVMTVILYGVLLLMSLFVTTEPGTNFYLITINATLILRFLFLLQGISLVHYFMSKIKSPKVVTVIVTGFALLLSPITTMLGILDTGMNIRAWIGKDKVK